MAILNKGMVRLLWFPALNLLLAAFIAYLGIRSLLGFPPGAQAWFGWLLVAVATAKAGIWLLYARLRFQTRQGVH